MGFDRSLPVQFLDYVGQLARGDLGTSLTTGQPVRASSRKSVAACTSAPAHRSPEAMWQTRRIHQHVLPLSKPFYRAEDEKPVFHDGTAYRSSEFLAVVFGLGIGRLFFKEVAMKPLSK